MISRRPETKPSDSKIWVFKHQICKQDIQSSQDFWWRRLTCYSLWKWLMYKALSLKFWSCQYCCNRSVSSQTLSSAQLHQNNTPQLSLFLAISLTRHFERLCYFLKYHIKHSESYGTAVRASGHTSGWVWT